MHQAELKSKSRFGRLKLVGAGVILASIGVLRMGNGIQVVRHGSGQPMFSWGLIAAGILCLVLACIPISWVAWAAQTKRAQKTH
jgi:uncharacterized membrane protein YidH (DUF202 family)